MADQPNLLLGASNYSEQVMRALAIKGDLPRELAPVYLPTFQVEDFTRPEFQWSKRAFLWEMGATAPAVAGELSRVALSSRVAAASQRAVLAVVTKIIIATPTAGGTGIELGLNVLGSGIADPTESGRPRDDRMHGKTESAFALTSGSAATNPMVGVAHTRLLLQQNVILQLEGAWILSNNDNAIFRYNLMVIASTANLDLRVSMEWRERELLPEEIR